MSKASDHLVVSQYVSVIGGALETDQVCCDGGRISTVTVPGCWGPIITPRVTGGHEVTAPVKVEGAMPGDSIAIYVEKLKIVSRFGSTGTGRPIPGRFDGDPSVKAVCPKCKTVCPDTVLVGFGEDAIRCANCGEVALPQTYDSGVTVAFSQEDNIAVALAPEGAKRVAEMTAKGEVFLPEGAQQHLATILGRADVFGLPIRQRPMIGNIGCVPAVAIPSAKNAGDCIGSLAKTDRFAVPAKEDITDAHMDINEVGEGCIVIAPVRVEGGGVYIGDVHLTQGDGEIAGHTLDMCADVTIRVKVLKGLELDGPILLPVVSELDSRFVPFSDEEYARAQKLYQDFGGGVLPRSYPVQIVGSGSGMDAALQDALQRAVKLTGLSMGEIKNRATLGGELGIGRTIGLVYLTVFLEEAVLEKAGLLELVREQYC